MQQAVFRIAKRFESHFEFGQSVRVMRQVSQHRQPLLGSGAPFAPHCQEVGRRVVGSLKRRSGLWLILTGFTVALYLNRLHIRQVYRSRLMPFQPLQQRRSKVLHNEGLRLASISHTASIAGIDTFRSTPTSVSALTFGQREFLPIALSLGSTHSGARQYVSDEEPKHPKTLRLTRRQPTQETQVHL